MPKLAWRRVFDLAVIEAKKLKKKHPNSKWPQLMKKAWKTQRVKKAKAAYHKKYGKNGSYKKKKSKKRK